MRRRPRVAIRTETQRNVWTPNKEDASLLSRKGFSFASFPIFLHAICYPFSDPVIRHFSLGGAAVAVNVGEFTS